MTFMPGEPRPGPVGRSGPIKSNAPSTEVANYHFNDDKDQSAQAHHHTLGKGSTQAAPGNQLVLLPRTAGTVQAGNAPSAVWFTAGLADDAGFFNTKLIWESGSGSFRIKEAGWYSISWVCGFVNGGGGLRGSRLNRNSGNILIEGASAINAVNWLGHPVYWEGALLAEDLIQFQGYQDSGGLLALQPLYSRYSIRKVSDTYKGS